jgi:thiamine biosynthesis lipoprotein ApbE/transcriptional regulator of nitric oxide reductase
LHRLRSIALRLFRAAVIVALAWMVFRENTWREAQRNPAVTLEQARKFFPSADRLSPRDLERGGHYVFTAHQLEPLGYVLTTAPEGNDLIGYSGPSNVLVALDTHGAIVGSELLASGDTADHVALVRAEEKFARAFHGWKPANEKPPDVAAVSGATLTSAAIAEGIVRRLAGHAPSLRFPEPVTFEEVRNLFPDAARMNSDGEWLRVLDNGGATLGFVVRTAPWSDNISGYRGPSESLVALRPDGRTIAALRLRKSFDTPDYVDSVRDDKYWMKKVFVGKTTDEVSRMDWDKAGVEGVSGATQTSYAMAEGLKRRFAAETRRGVESWKPRAHDWALAAVVLGACVMAFTHLRGMKWVRRAWQALLIGYVGLASGDLLSLSLLAGWAQSGVAWRALPGLVFMLVATLLLPWASGRQVYCHQICPHGAAQQWLGSLIKRKRHLPKPLSLTFEAVPFALLALAVLAVLRAWPLDLADIEPFDAWVWRAAGLATLIVAGVGLVGSLFIPQAYCRYGCPTGALLRLVWSHGSSDRFGWRDWFALALVVLAFAARPSIWPAPAQTVEFRGRAMGTAWMVKLDRPTPVSLHAEIAAVFERVEAIASNWRADSAVSRFNEVQMTEFQTVPRELAWLVGESSRISRTSGGAFDITVAPLVRLWGFGPGGKMGTPPAAAALAEARTHVGWEKIETAGNSLRKLDPQVTLDLSAIGEGWAVDEVCALLEHHGHTRFLVESGGELRARGAWQVAIEHPARVLTLCDQALATSGTYRQHWRDGTRERSHLVDPRTGRPIEHSTVSVSVVAKTCAEADAWATALNVLGVENGLPLAEREHIGAQFVTEDAGQLTIQVSPAWPNSVPLAAQR